MASIHEEPDFVGNYYLPNELETRIGKFVNYYNHESLDNLTPADVYYGRGQTILNRRERIKLKTLAMRKQNHYANRANQLN